MGRPFARLSRSMFGPTIVDLDPPRQQERIGADPTGGAHTIVAPELWWPNGMGDQPFTD